MPAETQVNIREIARLAGVSIATVSRVINNSPAVKPDTRQKVLTLTKKLHFQPNYLAQSLSRSQSLAVGIFTHAEPDMKAHYFVEVLRGINQALATTPHSLSINPKHLSPIGGLLALAPSPKDPILAEAARRNIPTVLVNAASTRFPTVDMDNVTAAYEIVHHLLELGHRRVALIRGNPRVTNDRDRFDGYRKALSEHGVVFDENLVTQGDFDQVKGYQAMKQLLTLKERPTAVFAANDHMAIGTIKAIQDAGLSVPQDVAVAGFDDIDIAAHVTPPLTTIRQPLLRLGQEAARLLLDLVSGKSTRERRQVLLEGKLIIRRSCGAYSTPSTRSVEINTHQ